MRTHRRRVRVHLGAEVAPRDERFGLAGVLKGHARLRAVLAAEVFILGTNRFVLLTGVSLLCATLGARWLAKLNGPEEFGAYLLMLFLFTLGLPADLLAVLRQAPLLFLFCAIIAVMNVAFTLVAGRLLRLNLEELLLAMNATLGGPPTAAAMAISAGWPRLVLPGLLIGLWGYVIGTPIGVMVVELLKR